MMLIIETQDRENYAAHNGFTGEYHWKMKGGQSIKVTNIPEGVGPMEVIETVRLDVEDTTNDYFRSEIIGWNIVEDGWLSPFERSQMEYEGQILCKEPVINYQDYLQIQQRQSDEFFQSIWI